MSQYLYQTTFQGQESTILAGFCARTATYFAKLFKGLQIDEPRRETKPLASDSELLKELDSWGVAVPQKLEDALAGDAQLWEFGSGDLKVFGRKFRNFGYIPPLLEHMAVVETAKGTGKKLFKRSFKRAPS